MNPPDSRRSIAYKLITGILILYLMAPVIAGLSRDVDRRGPKIFWIEDHEFLCTLAHEFVYDQKPREPPWERGWFYGLKGKPDRWIEAKEVQRRFEAQVDETTLLEFRRSVWDGKGRFPVVIARSEWPTSFLTNEVLELRTEQYGIYIVLKRGPDHEAGIFLLGNETTKDAVENDNAYSRGVFWKSDVYHYYRELKIR